MSWIVAFAIFGVIASTTGFILHIIQSKNESEGIWNARTLSYQETLRQTFSNALIILHTVRANSDGSQSITLDRFTSISHELKHMFPSLDSLAWVPRVKVKDISNFEKKGIDSGIFDISVRNFDGSKPQDLQGADEDVFPIYFVSPITLKENVKTPSGINVASLSGRRELLLRACISGDTLIGHWPTLGNRSSGTGHIVLYLAVYDANLAQIYPYQACSRLAGYLTALINVDRLLATAFRSLPALGADIYLIDPKAPAEFRRMGVLPGLHPQDGFIPLDGDEALRAARQVHWLEVGGLELSLAFVPQTSGWSSSIPFSAWLVFASGLLLTFALTIFFFKQRLATLNLIVEVDRRTAVENALRASEYRFRLALRDSNVSVFSQDRDLRYTWIYNENIGLRIEDMLGKRHSDLFNAEANREMEALKRSVLETGFSVRREVPVVIGNRTMIRDLRIEAFYDRNGAIDGIICVSVDVTEGKRMKEALSEAVATAERANAAKSRFLAAASHDLRQPFQAMQLYHELLASRLSTPQHRELCGHLGESIRMGRELLTALLDVSTLDAGTVTPKIVGFALQPSLDSLMAEFEGQAARLGIRLRQVATSAVVRSDRVLLERVLRNLVTNALRYTLSGRILVGCRRRRGQIEIQVWDTGIGIPTDKLDLIFEDFYQIGNAERRLAQGLGLGLGIVARTVRLLAHRISVRSWPGRGSVFSVTLVTTESISPVRSFEAANGAVSPQRILIIEDEDRQRHALRLLLEQFGHTVLCANSADEALERVAQAPMPPTVIISDLRLPGRLNGIEIIARLRANLANTVPALLVTGDTDKKMLRSAATAGMIVLHKPFNQEALLEKLALIVK